MNLLPAADSKWLTDQPEAVLSMRKQTEQQFQIDHGAVYRVKNQAHVHIVQSRLSRQVVNLVPALLDEMEVSVATAWGTDTTESPESASMKLCG